MSVQAVRIPRYGESLVAAPSGMRPADDWRRSSASDALGEAPGADQSIGVEHAHDRLLRVRCC